MLNYGLTGNNGFFIDRLTIPFTQIVNGANSFSFGNVNTSLFAAKINSGMYCVPIMFYIYNSTGLDFSLAVFKNSGGDWNSTCDIIDANWTILYCTDKSKVNHSHIQVINDFLSLVFVAPIAATQGGLTIYCVFTAVPGLQTI